MTIQFNNQSDIVTPSSGQLNNSATVVDKALVLQGGNNLFQYSQDFTNAVWTKNNSTITPNITIAPDGTQTASKLLATAVNNVHTLLQIKSISSGTTYTASAYIKAAEYGYVGLQFYDGTTSTFATFNLATGALVGTTPAAYTSNSVGNGWWKFSITAVLNGTNGYFYIQPSLVSGNYFLGDGYSGIYIWGAQLEAGTVASAYTPTTTVAITTTNNLSVPSGNVVASGALTIGSTVANYGAVIQNSNFYIYGGGGYIGLSDGSNQMLLTLQNSAITGLRLIGGIPLSWTPTSTVATNPDLLLYRDAANILAQRNSTNAQTFRLYNTYTDASNNERLSVTFANTSNVAIIQTEAIGTGVVRPLALQANNGGNVGIGTVAPDTPLTIYSANNATGSLVHFKNPNATATPDWYMSVGGVANFEGYFKIGRTAGAYEFGIDNYGNPITLKSWQVTGNGGLISSNNPATGIALNSGSYLGLSALNYMNFSIAYNEKMRLDSTGNFLIGTTTSPSGNNGLVVTGNVTIGGSLTVTGNIAFQNTTINNVTVNTTDSIVTTNTTPSTSTTTGSIVAYGGLGVAGNITTTGIISSNIVTNNLGTTASLNLMQVSNYGLFNTVQTLGVTDPGSGRIDLFSFNVGANNARGGQITFGEINGLGLAQESITCYLNQFQFAQAGNNPITFYTNGSERVRFDGSGNVGIGTISPTSNLHVIGTANVSASLTVGGIVTVTNTTVSSNTTTGALVVNGGVGINGALNATSKSFSIPHPTKPGQTLRHGSLEGPEFGVYVRGRLTGDTIHLPEYWTKLVDPDTITVELTPIGKHQKLYVALVDNTQVIVGNENLFGKTDCFYTVYAERNDIDKLTVES